MKAERIGWDNLSDELGEQEEVGSLSECRDLCQRQDDCMQYRVASGQCSTSSSIRLGQSTTDEVQSGWMTERIENAVDSIEPCQGADWITE